jgi:hypothetical protein
MPSTSVEVPEAKFLDIILYSREQILKEKESMPSEDKSDEIPDVPWGIISIKAQVLSLNYTVTSLCYHVLLTTC